MNEAQEKLQAQMQALRESYAAQLPDKIRQIDELWSGLQSQWDNEAFRTLHRQVHGLTGSGATFGFSMLSEAARTLEILLKELIAEGEAPLSSDRRDEVTLYLNALKESSLKSDQQKPASNATVPTTSRCDTANRVIFLVDDDVQFAESLSLQIGYFGYAIRVFSTLAEAYRTIIQSPPAMLLLDIDFPEDSDGGFTLLEQLDRELGFVLPAFFISAHDGLEYRLKAVRAGGRAYFTKPLDVARLIDRLEEQIACRREEPYRVLIVDDSASLAGYYATILKGADMTTETVSDPLQVMEPLLEFVPDLVLMDVYMPQCSGLELAAVIRQQERFVGIPIVFLSAETDIDKQLAAMNLGGDDFLTKPIQPEHLVASVTARVQRARVLRSFMVRDSLTGLLNHTTLKAQLDMQMARVRRQGGKLSFAMLDIDHFKSVNDTYGHPTGDRVIRSLSRLLQQRLRTSDVVGRYGGEEFAVIFNDTGGAEALKVLDGIREDFGHIRHLHEKGEFSVTISAGVAEFPGFDDPATINEAADQALYKAKHGGRNRVALAHR
jgi:diguanylate cyclase (GGDEF)-like protein